jgi:uncharacterized membrane protein YfcA
MQKPLLIAVLAVFGVLSAYVLWQVGYLGLLVNNLNHPAGQQLFADLVIALTLVLVWMWFDARKTGRTFWPWAIATLLLGSFGPLVYLLLSKPSRS